MMSLSRSANHNAQKDGCYHGVSKPFLSHLKHLKYLNMTCLYTTHKKLGILDFQVKYMENVKQKKKVHVPVIHQQITAFK